MTVKFFKEACKASKWEALQLCATVYACKSVATAIRKNEWALTTTNYRKASYTHFMLPRLLAIQEPKGRGHFLNDSHWFGFPWLSRWGQKACLWFKGSAQEHPHTQAHTHNVPCVISHYYLPPEQHVLQCKSTSRQLESLWLMSSKSVWRASTGMKVALVVLPPAWLTSMASFQRQNIIPTAEYLRL